MEVCWTEKQEDGRKIVWRKDIEMFACVPPKRKFELFIWLVYFRGDAKE